MKVIGVIERSKSGKTTVIEKMISCFKDRGYSVGTVKDLKRADYQADIEGKNTFRHKKAGAEPVTARGDKNTDIMFTHRLDIEDLLLYHSNDIVLLEGFRDFAVPQLLTGCDEEQLKEKYTGKVFAVSGIYAAEHKEWQGLPCFNALENISALCDYVLEKVPDYDASLPSLYLEGRRLALSPALRMELAGILGNKSCKLEYRLKGEENEN